MLVVGTNPKQLFKQPAQNNMLAHAFSTLLGKVLTAAVLGYMFAQIDNKDVEKVLQPIKNVETDRMYLEYLWLLPTHTKSAK